jgi:glycosyltransferase involved in cell wall biosynthesis
VTVNVQTDGQPRETPQAEARAGIGRACIIVPAYDAAGTIEGVVAGLRAALPEVCTAEHGLIVVDDGSHDDTGDLARRAGADVLTHVTNRGKGAALATGLAFAERCDFDVALAVDADGQHPPASAKRVLYAATDPRALVLGVRDLARDGAPRANRFSNGISNFFLSGFTGTRLHDTQCGLRRYPVRDTLALGVRAAGYAFEAEILVRAVAAGVPIVETPVAVVYPPGEQRVTHFDSVRDPARIVAVVVRTLYELRRG